MAYEKNMDYAGFWKRFAAVFIDGLIWLIPNSILQLALVDQAKLARGDGDALAGFFIYYIVITLMGWILCGF